MNRISIDLTDDYRVNYLIGSSLAMMATGGIYLLEFVFIVSGAETLRGLLWRTVGSVFSIALAWAVVCSFAVSYGL